MDTGLRQAAVCGVTESYTTECEHEGGTAFPERAQCVEKRDRWRRSWPGAIPCANQTFCILRWQADSLPLCHQGSHKTVRRQDLVHDPLLANPDLNI